MAGDLWWSFVQWRDLKAALELEQGLAEVLEGGSEWLVIGVCLAKPLLEMRSWKKGGRKLGRGGIRQVKMAMGACSVVGDWSDDL